jgi:hypothetical protein
MMMSSTFSDRPSLHLIHTPGGGTVALEGNGGLTLEVEDDHLDRILGSELDLRLGLEDAGEPVGDPPVVHLEQAEDG